MPNRSPVSSFKPCPVARRINSLWLETVLVHRVRPEGVRARTVRAAHPVGPVRVRLHAVLVRHHAVPAKVDATAGPVTADAIRARVTEVGTIDEVADRLVVVRQQVDRRAGVAMIEPAIDVVATMD